MKLFISWSGERSRLLAEALRQWLPGVINAAEPWISSSDIDPGARWGPELARQLEATKYGILCVTAENVNAPWLLFEAGALSKYVDQSRVVPLMLDIKPTDIQGPLTQFQGIQTKEEDIHKLVTKINKAVFDAGEKGVDQSIIDNSFKKWWPDLKEYIDKIPASIPKVRKNERSEREIIEEILTLVRKIDGQTIQGVSFSPSPTPTGGGIYFGTPSGTAYPTPTLRFDSDSHSWELKPPEQISSWIPYSVDLDDTPKSNLPEQSVTPRRTPSKRRKKTKQ